VPGLVHLINPSNLSFGVAVITPRWLYVLAAATGTKWGDPHLVDETLDPINLDDIGAGDVVGIGIHTGNALKGYEIGRQARARGAWVVCGGIHATLFPDEALALASSVRRGGRAGSATRAGACFLGNRCRTSRCLASSLPNRHSTDGLQRDDVRDERHDQAADRRTARGARHHVRCWLWSRGAKEPRTCSSGERSRRVRRAKLITLKRSIRSTTLASVRGKKNSQPRSGRSLNS